MEKDLSKKEYLIVVQCEQTVGQVCPGFICEHNFTIRGGGFSRYPADQKLRYNSISCGGCPGRPVMRKLQSFKTKFKAKEQGTPDKVIVHLASCITRNNHHGPECPHKDYIKSQILRAGFEYVEDSYVSKLAQQRRDEGVYDFCIEE